MSRFYIKILIQIPVFNIALGLVVLLENPQNGSSLLLPVQVLAFWAKLGSQVLFIQKPIKYLAKPRVSDDQEVGSAEPGYA